MLSYIQAWYDFEYTGLNAFIYTDLNDFVDAGRNAFVYTGLTDFVYGGRNAFVYAGFNDFVYRCRNACYKQAGMTLYIGAEMLSYIQA